MPRETTNFVLRCSPQERQVLAAVAQHMRRSSSSAMRELIYEAAAKFGVKPDTAQQAAQQPQNAG